MDREERDLLVALFEAMAVPLPSGWTASALDGVVIAGMGSSAIGASLVAALTAGECPIPITVFRGDPLRGKAGGGRGEPPIPLSIQGTSTTTRTSMSTGPAPLFRSVM